MSATFKTSAPFDPPSVLGGLGLDLFLLLLEMELWASEAVWVQGRVYPSTMHGAGARGSRRLYRAGTQRKIGGPGTWAPGPM